MIFNNTDDDDKRDFFDGPDLEEEQPERKPRYKPEDPRYYEDDEWEWEHLKPRRRTRLWLFLATVVVIIALITGFYLRFFAPCVVDASQVGYVENIDEEGSIFHTFEGILLPYKELMDSTRVYDRNFRFTAENEKIAAELRRMQTAARPVRVRYKKYHATLPWRGSSKIIVTAVDTVDPARILPPEFTPAYYRNGTYKTDSIEIKAIDEREKQ